MCAYANDIAVGENITFGGRWRSVLGAGKCHAVDRLKDIVVFVAANRCMMRRDGAVARESQLTVAGTADLESTAERVERCAPPNVFTGFKRKTCGAQVVVDEPVQPACECAKQPETLEFNTNVCGDASLSIGPDARLDVINSEIATTHRTISAGVCTRGYTVFCYGTLVARDSSFLYISGNRSEFFGRTGSGVLDKVIISRSDGASLRLVAVDGSRLSIRNSSFITGGKYGLYLLRRTKTPVRIEDTTLLGAAADVFMSSGTAELVLVDCTFRKNKVSFVNSDGSVRIKWRAHVKVEKEGRPVAGAAVVAESEDEKVTATTDEDGLAVLEVTEQILTARGARMITPHVFRVIDGAAILAESEPVAITRKAEIAGEVRLTIE